MERRWRIQQESEKEKGMKEIKKAKQKKVPEEALNKCCLIKFFDRIERNSVNKLTLRIKDP